MLPELGFSLAAQYDRPLTQVIPLLKAAGFSSVSPLWSPELDLESLADCVWKHTMSIQSLHAPHKGIALLWNPTLPASVPVQESILRTVDACARYEVPILVLHGWQGLVYTFPETPLDFRFFDTLISHARRKNVSVAFENLEGEEYLQALMTRYQNEPHVGFCWDSGHDHCYPHKLDFLKAFGDRLIMTHLNDNLGLRDPNGIPSGLDDLHFLPFDGNISWDDALNRLRALPRQSVLNFELKLRSHSADPGDLRYAGCSLEQFLETAGTRALEIGKRYARLMESR